MRRDLQIPTGDGNCPSSFFAPDRAGRWPGVLVFMDGLGMGPPMHAIARRIADHGYAVLLPDLFYRSGPYARHSQDVFRDPEKRKDLIERFMSKASAANVMRDTAAYLDALAAQPETRPGKIGTTGYCMGGARSLSAAGTYPDRIGACASFHGGNLATDAPDSPHLLVPNIKARVYVAGAIEDPSFPEEQKQTLEAALTAAGVAHTVETYPAKHGWVPDDTPVHDPVCAERHFRALFELFHTTLA